MYFFDIYFHLLFRIMPRKDMECHQWYNPRRNQVSLKTKKNNWKRPKRASYVLHIFSTCLKNHLPNFFIQILLLFFIWISLVLVRLHLKCCVQIWALQCKEDTDLWSQSEGALTAWAGEGAQDPRGGADGNGLVQHGGEAAEGWSCHYLRLLYGGV